MGADIASVMQDGVAAPLGDIIASIGRGVAEAQIALDHASVEETLAMYDAGGKYRSSALREIGYRPTFYVLPETSCEVQVSMKVTGAAGARGSGPGPGGGRPRAYATPVDATFANNYAFNGATSAKLTFKIVPVPPPSSIDGLRLVPTLAGSKGSDAWPALVALGLGVSATDDKGVVISENQAAGRTVKEQSPLPGVPASVGAVVALVFA